MLRTATLIAVMALFSVGALAQSGRVQPTVTPTPDDTERVLTEEIKLNVLAFDENGNFFKDVRPTDLVITENNILHQPESVRRIPANVLIVMDTGGDMRAVKSLEQTRRVAAGVVDALRPGDSIAVLAYANKPEIIGEWTSDKTQALAAIRHSNFGIRSAFVDALKMATDYMMRSPIENRHIVLITDGTDSQGRSAAKADAFKRLLTTDISVHVLSYGSLEVADIQPRTKTMSNTPPRPALPEEVANQLPNGARDMAKAPKVGPTINLDRKMLQTLKARQTDLEASEHQLEALAENTNGEFIIPGTVDEMVDKTALVARMIDSSYVVTYTPKIPVAAGHGVAERNILVTSKRDGLVVQARRKLLVDRK
jgi:hypothetical protein